MSAQAKPVKLQVNNSGAWKDVVRFDADDAIAQDKVMAAVESLGTVNPDIKWRICTADSLQAVLMIWSAAKGWKTWKDR